ncbi:MAG TPA: peptide chain release factor 1 [Aquifex aeolicus]|uniref:Peptide chain release factor 1 n=1 Tax=Aquifex aeolicus TaxID=63363 RepID=A0A9D0YRE2_AQUAO|nr:peptide chain release factor 1 [Aquifex aeolicus]
MNPLSEVLLKKLDAVEKKYKELQFKLSQPDVFQNPKEFQRLSKELNSLEELYTTYQEYKKTLNAYREAKEILSLGDEELKELAKEEIKQLEPKLQELSKRLKILLLPKDERDNKNVILEIRAGVGGEEAALFAADLLRMYQRYAEEKGWKFQILDANKTGLGGYKEVIVLIEGKDVYSHLKYESGVHRVQRVPVTESGGRIHTSTATVAVLPEVEETEVEINPAELKIETFRASGAGGQYVNTTETAVRITHIPTGIVVQCQDERSQFQNKQKALKILRAKLKQFYEEQKLMELTEERKKQVGHGDRSEKIRTYNFPQNRVTDHRINLTLHKLDQIMEGKLDELIETLQQHEQQQKLKELEETLK